jgi:hypothetical protein
MVALAGDDMSDTSSHSRSRTEALFGPIVKLPSPEPVVDVTPGRTVAYLRALVGAIVTANSGVVSLDGGMDAIMRQVVMTYERIDGAVHIRPEFFDQARDEIRDAVAGLESNRG